MPIEGVEQPQLLQVNREIRLRKYDGIYDFALKWYQDTELVYLVDGVRKPYDLPRLRAMYEYLNRKGELYFIEARGFGPIGDVTFLRDDMPIVIGESSYRGRGIGSAVIRCLVERGRTLGYDALFVREIYDFNAASRHCFESVGFEAVEKTERGHRFRLNLL